MYAAGGPYAVDADGYPLYTPVVDSSQSTGSVPPPRPRSRSLSTGGSPRRALGASGRAIDPAAPQASQLPRKKQTPLGRCAQCRAIGELRYECGVDRGGVVASRTEGHWVVVGRAWCTLCASRQMEEAIGHCIGGSHRSRRHPHARTLATSVSRWLRREQWHPVVKSSVVFVKWTL